MKNKISLYLLLLLWVMIVVFSFQSIIIRIDENIEEMVTGIGRAFFRDIENTRLWNAKHGGVYVPVTSETQPNPYLTVPNRDVVTSDGLRLTLINPAYMTRQMAELAKSNSQIQYHITSLRPIRPENAADDWEAHALNLFANGRPEYFEFLPDSMVYRYMAPLPVKQACLKCHAKQDYRVGDIRGGISFTIPAGKFAASALAGKKRMALMHGLALALGIGVLTVFHALQQRQTRKIQEQNLLLAREIEERLQAEEALKSSRQRLALHFEHTPLGVIEWDLGFRIGAWNPAASRIFGFTAAEALGEEAITLLIAEEEREQARLSWKAAISGPPDAARSTHRHLTGDGRTIFCDWHHTLLSKPDGQPVGAASLVMDITDRERLESQLRQAHKMEAVGTIAGGIAHDFNNILAAILGYADMALDDLPAEGPAHRKISRVIEAGNRAKELVQRILTVSRTSPHHREKINFQELVTEILGLVRASTPATITFQISLQAEGIQILADAGEMHQVLMNLCTNAAQAMEDEGGVMTLTLEPVTREAGSTLPEGAYLRLTVSDTGHGIPPEILDRIYDPFFTTKAVNKGTGLGLAMVHRIIENHGGTINAESKTGQGTTFTVLLPRSESEELAQPAPSGELPTGCERILVIDDEWPVADLTRQRLEGLGYRVELRTSSPEALELFRAQPEAFDLVITDQTMPVLTGQQLAQAIHELRPALPIILCTGYSAKVDGDKIKELGIAAFLMKPVERQELAATMRKLLDRGARQERG